jgi:hypothetical protein
MSRRKSMRKDTSIPSPISRRTVLRYAAQEHAARPMIFWEKARLWDWAELSLDVDGEANTEVLRQNLLALNDHFQDETIPSNKRSTVLIIRATVPTQREFLRLCDKYHYEIDLEALEATQNE